MTKIHVLTGLDQPRLRVWRDRTERVPAALAYDAAYKGRDADGLALFQSVFDHQVHEQVHALVHNGRWEAGEHAKTLPRTTDYRIPADLWCAEGTTRVLAENPFLDSHNHVRIHLVTALKYRGGRLFLWTQGQASRWIDEAGSDAVGPYFDVSLDGRERHLFLFKFANAAGRHEPDYANRLWCAQDGAEVWVHSQSSSVSTRRPDKKQLVVRLLDFGAPASTPGMHLWQEDSDFIFDGTGTRESGGWVRFEVCLYTDRPYRFMFGNPGLDPPQEHDEARRTVMLREDGSAWTYRGDGTPGRIGSLGVWTLEGDHHLFGSEPAADKEVSLEVSHLDPACGVGDPLVLDVWVNRARSPLLAGLQPGADRHWSFQTYPDVVTSFRFRSGAAIEKVERHTLRIPVSEVQPTRLHVVLGRADPLRRRPPEDLFRDPPFSIERPGTWIASGHVRFAVHCPGAATVEVIGEWTEWERQPVALRSTLDGAYWWGQVPVNDITGRLGRPTLHGTLYKFVLSQTRQVQDPAADWVENSGPEAASRLVDHEQYVWKSAAWRRPGWEHLIVYQLHPSRFARRAGTAGLAGVTREVAAADGYLRQIDATALLLMPTCEFAGDQSWGYNPSFFYAVESAYGGPDALKRLVDACHEQGVAVLLDVVFNHAGTSDNVLWGTARESYFDGDTDWGAMINFDHPQVIHFFEQNLVHFIEKYRVDGFRFDFTRVIRFGDQWVAHVRQPGSGGGWEFLRRLRAAVRARDERCILMAENLPNDWDLTRRGGQMDTQWCDEFHDRLVEAARGWDVMGPLADALKVTHTQCDQWYESTNYPESHDEAGNEPNRISFVAGPGRGLRRNKVAAAATILSRGIPLWFMGAESGEWRQFSKDGDQTLDLDSYETDADASRVRRWWGNLCRLRRGNHSIQGPAPLRVSFAQERILAFIRGDAGDLFVLLNFGDWAGWRSLAQLNLPDGDYKELLNSTWGDYRIASENEDEHSNGGWDARLDRGSSLNIPDYGVVVLGRR